MRNCWGWGIVRDEELLGMGNCWGWGIVRDEELLRIKISSSLAVLFVVIDMQACNISKDS